MRFFTDHYFPFLIISNIPNQILIERSISNIVQIFTVYLVRGKKREKNLIKNQEKIYIKKLYSIFSLTYSLYHHLNIELNHIFLSNFLFVLFLCFVSLDRLFDSIETKSTGFGFFRFFGVHKVERPTTSRLN